MVAVLVNAAAFPATLVFPPLGPWDPVTWLELTAKHKVTTWAGVPTQYWRMLRHPGIDSMKHELEREERPVGPAPKPLPQGAD